MNREQRRKERQTEQRKYRRFLASEAGKHIVERWSRPQTEDDIAILRDIQQLPRVIVQKCPKEQMEYMRMVPGECHTNSLWLVWRNPKYYKAVHGWMPVLGTHFVIHSVVQIPTGEYVCVTPFEMGLYAHMDHFAFMPDPKMIANVEYGDETMKVDGMTRDGVALDMVGLHI